jgi:hypothetical protein
MKKVNFLKSNADRCRRKIVITEINILRNLAESELTHEKIIREMGKLHSLWFKDTDKNMRVAELLDNHLDEQSIFMQANL